MALLSARLGNRWIVRGRSVAEDNQRRPRTSVTVGESVGCRGHFGPRHHQSRQLSENVDEEAITLRLTRDQAFVLSDWLYQVMFQSDDLEGIVHDRAVW